jgi:hypothetical protein
MVDRYRAGRMLLAGDAAHVHSPAGGQGLNTVDGPYNEHLLRDVGQGNLAFGMIALVALLTGGMWLARATGLAAVVANLPHHAYHQVHVHVLPTVSDQVLQTITLSLMSMTSVMLVILAFGLPVRPEWSRDGDVVDRQRRRADWAS